jgi:hypothetical protein
MTIIVNENNLVNGSFDIAASFKESGDSTESKTVTLRLQFNDVPLKDVVTGFAQSARISWQNNVGRKHFESFQTGQIVNVDAASPGKAPVDHRVNMIKAFIAAGVDPETAKAMANKVAENPGVLKNL